ncbi:sensor histidine kinase [Leifsonia xyli]|uniref:sensor histidine kinase n=1 Tax=Leifsonia xyli TaxID=1575 RepID=UPI003D676F4D
MTTEHEAEATRLTGVRLPPSLRRPSSIPWESVLDVVAAITFAIAVWQTGATGDPAAAPVLALIAAAVVTRRKVPLAATIAATLASGLVLLTPGAVIAVWTLAQVVLFTAALRLLPRIVIILGALHAATLYLGALVTFAESPVSSLALITPVWTVAVIAVGFALRTQRAYVAALEQHADAAVRNRETVARQRIGEERLRIARDLHDSLAHTIAVAGIHALAAEATIETAPAEARHALQQIHATMRSTQSELQGIVRVLRIAAEDSAPVAGQDAIPALVDSFTRAIRIDYRPTTLPPWTRSPPPRCTGWCKRG